MLKVAVFLQAIGKSMSLKGRMPSITERAYEEHTYERKLFRDKDGAEHRIYIHSSVGNPLEALIEGYRSNAIRP